MAHHVHRTARLGAWVLIRMIWYDYRRPGKTIPRVSGSFAGAGALILSQPALSMIVQCRLRRIANFETGSECSDPELQDAVMAPVRAEGEAEGDDCPLYSGETGYCLCGSQASRYGGQPWNTMQESTCLSPVLREPHRKSPFVTMCFVDSGYKLDQAQSGAFEASRISITATRSPKPKRKRRGRPGRDATSSRALPEISQYQ